MVVIYFIIVIRAITNILKNFMIIIVCCISSIINFFYSTLFNSTSTHWTWFQCYIYITINQSPIFNFSCSFFNSNYFCMSK